MKNNVEQATQIGFDRVRRYRWYVSAPGYPRRITWAVDIEEARTRARQRFGMEAVSVEPAPRMLMEKTR